MKCESVDYDEISLAWEVQTDSIIQRAKEHVSPMDSLVLIILVREGGGLADVAPQSACLGLRRWFALTQGLFR